MFFTNFKQARIAANIETQVTGRKHKIVKTVKHLCTLEDIKGYTIVLCKR